MDNCIAVIIPSLNSPIIDRVISAVLAQEGQSYLQEIVVVGKDNAGLIKTAERVRFIDTGQAVLAAVARNRGIVATTADLLIFLDSDCLPQPGWLLAHQAAHQAGHQVVSGSLCPTRQGYWHLNYNLTLFHEAISLSPAGPRNFLAGFNLSVEREVINQVGCMDEHINRVEDIEWTIRMKRANFQPYFWPEAAVSHAHNRLTWRQVWQDCAFSGFHMRQLRLQHPDLLEAPRLLRYPRLVWYLSPFIAAWATVRIVQKRPNLVLRFWYTLPALYLTKIAWCWGASHEEWGTTKVTS